jgi:hypothetical protein
MKLPATVGEALRDVTVVVNVREARTTRWRLWCAVQLMHLAAWVAGVGIRVEQ